MVNNLKNFMQQVADLDKQHKLSLHTTHLEALTQKRRTQGSSRPRNEKEVPPYLTENVRSIRASFIPKIKLHSGEMSHASPQIAKAFRDFYADLYNVKGDLASLPRRRNANVYFPT